VSNFRVVLIKTSFSINQFLNTELRLFVLTYHVNFSQAKKKIEKVFLLLKNIEQENLNSHTAYFLVKNCLFVPRLNFLLRTSPFWKFPNCIKSIDIAIRNSLQKFLNIKFNDSCFPSYFKWWSRY
jgi:hypothetical protein